MARPRGSRDGNPAHEASSWTTRHAPSRSRPDRPEHPIPSEDVLAQLREHPGDLAEEVFAVGAGEGAKVLTVPPGGAASGHVRRTGGPRGKRGHLGVPAGIEEE